MLSRPVKILIGTLGALVLVVSTIITIQKRRKKIKKKEEGRDFLRSRARGDPAARALRRNENEESERQDSPHRAFDDEDSTGTNNNFSERMDYNDSLAVSGPLSEFETAEEREAVIASNLARTRCARCGEFGHKCSDCRSPAVPIGRDWGRTCRRMAFILRRKEGLPIECEPRASRGCDEEIEVES